MDNEQDKSIVDALDTGPHLAGKQIYHYNIIKEIGRGGMGVVYRAIDTKLNRPVAIKFLAPGMHQLETSRDRFLREAQSASSVNHPNICTVYEINEWQGMVFIVMEFVDGQTLSEVIAQEMSGSRGTSTTDVHHAVDIAMQIASGLTKAHEKQVVHRDIKPDNIMVTRDGLVKIMDFGLAKLAGETRLTKSRSTVGTVGFMSPEQIQGSNVDRRSDIFSLGVVLYEMLAGQLPFRGDHEAALMYEILNVDPPSLLELCSGVDPELNSMVFKCLAKKPEQRYQTMDEVLASLRAYEPHSVGKEILHPSITSARIQEYRNIGAHVFTNFEGRKYRFGKPSRNIITLGILVLVAAVIVFLITRLPSSGNGLMSINSEPPGAAITLNGDIMGVTPLLNQKVATGDLAIRAQYDGYAAIDTIVSLRKGEIQRIFFEMSKIPPAEEGSRGESKEALRTPELKQTPPDNQLATVATVQNFHSTPQVCAYLATSLIERSPALTGRVLLLPFTYRGTQITGLFSQNFKKELQSKLASIAGWTLVQLSYASPLSGDVQAELARASGATYVVSGFYWQEQEDAGFTARLSRVVNGETMALVTARVDGSTFDWGNTSSKPENFEQATKKASLLSKGELGSNNALKVEIWTDRGDKDLLFVDGDTMRLYVRVNMNCHLRMFYILASGETSILIADTTVEAMTMQGKKPLDSLECGEPFGVEMIQVFARSEPFDPIVTRIEHGYSILAEELGEAVASTRGMKRISKRPVLQSEARLTITTVPKGTGTTLKK